MLVLTRKAEQSLIIGGVEVRVVELTAGHVVLGIVAPPEVKVYRKELWEKLQKESLPEAA